MSNNDDFDFNRDDVFYDDDYSGSDDFSSDDFDFDDDEYDEDDMDRFIFGDEIVKDDAVPEEELSEEDSSEETSSKSFLDRHSGKVFFILLLAVIPALAFLFFQFQGFMIDSVPTETLEPEQQLTQVPSATPNAVVTQGAISTQNAVEIQQGYATVQAQYTQMADIQSTISSLEAQATQVGGLQVSSQATLDAAYVALATTQGELTNVLNANSTLEAEIVVANSTLSVLEADLNGLEINIDIATVMVAHENPSEFASVFADVSVAGIFFDEMPNETMLLATNSERHIEDSANGRYIVETGVDFQYCDTTFAIHVDGETNEITVSVEAIGDFTVSRAYVQDHAEELHPIEVYKVAESQISILDQTAENQLTQTRIFVLVEVQESGFRCQNGQFQYGSFPIVTRLGEQNLKWLSRSISIGYAHITDLRGR